jgi:hypothetical protein
MNNAIEPLPEGEWFDAKVGKHFISDEIMKNLRHFKIGNANVLIVRHSNVCPLIGSFAR